MTTCQFEVEGRPVPQGSMTASYNRTTGTSHVHHVQGTALAMWRASIREAARAAGITLSLAPIVLQVQFGMPRPKQHLQLRGGRYVPKPRYMNARPALMPDLDKLLRAVMDSLTGIAYRDDAQVVDIIAAKVYGESTHVSISEWSPEGTLW